MKGDRLTLTFYWLYLFGQSTGVWYYRVYINRILAGNGLVFRSRFNDRLILEDDVHWSVCLISSLCTIWYHLHNLKNVKNTHGGVLLLVKLQASTCNFTKSNALPWVFFTFFKLYKRHQIAQHSALYLSESASSENYSRSLDTEVYKT